MEGHGSLCRPLPLRRKFWRTLPQLIRNGTVLIRNEPAEREDIRNAAQSILIDYIEREVMATFKRPSLVKSCDFYAAFYVAYEKAIRDTELAIWKHFGKEFEVWSAKHAAEPLTEKWAAYLTYAFREYPEPPQSNELYMNMAPLARAYESLLRQKYGKKYSHEQFYETLHTRFPTFLFRFIGMDTLIGALISTNLHIKRTHQEGMLVSRYSFYEPRLFILDENDTLVFKPAFLAAIRAHAQEQNFKEDHQGRAKDRGCPFLFAKERTSVLDFAIHELIEQHRAWFL